jgi:hypothetical protein
MSATGAGDAFLRPILNPTSSKENKMKRFLGFVVLATVIAGLAPQAAFADGWPLKGSFAVSFSTLPNTGNVSFCGGPAGAARVLEAHGTGSTSLGTFAFTLYKTVGAGGVLHGCLTFTAPDGDTLEATYAGTGLPANAHLFAPSAGTLTFTGGTGRFKNASGTAVWTAQAAAFYVANSWAGGGPVTAPIQGMAFYLIDGRIHRSKD